MAYLILSPVHSTQEKITRYFEFVFEEISGREIT